MTREPRSPALARALLAMTLPRRYRDSPLGDLEEEFRSRGLRDGWTSARRWYWAQALTSLPGAGRLRYRERDSDARDGSVLERTHQDFRYAVRALLARPLHTILATSTLALAIGVNTSIFSLVSQVIFIDLPIDDPEGLYWVWSVNAELQSDLTPTSLADFQDFRDRTRSFEAMAALQQSQMILTGVTEPERVTVARATANLMDLWGDQPVLGRGFAPGEDQVGAERVAVITQSMWENHYGRSPEVLGRSVRLNDEEYVIVGVASEQMETGNLGRAVVWIPLQMEASGLARDARTAMVTGRPRPGVTLADMQAEAIRIGEELSTEHPVTNRGWTIQVRTTTDSLVNDDVATVMTLLVFTVGLVLLIACANVANLVLVRASARVRELAIRAALGAGRWRIVRQLLTENLLIALAAGVLGVGLANLLLESLVLVTRGQFVLFNIAIIDRRVLTFTLVVSLLTPLLFGLLPAVGAVRPGFGSALRNGARAAGTRSGGRTRNALVVSQVALALTLMLVSGVLARSVIALQAVEPGFESDGVLSAVVQLPDAKYDDEAARLFFRELEARVASLPQVEAFGLAGGRPRLTLSAGLPFAVEGRPEVGLEALPTAYLEVVSSDYFDALRIPLIAGRFFDGREAPEASAVAILSREAAARFWPGEPAVGKRIRAGEDPGSEWLEVVGIVENVSGGSDPLSVDVPQVYVPAAQMPRRSMVLFARTAADERLLTAPIRQEVWRLDAEQPVDDVRTMSDFVYDANSFEYAIIGLFVAFALFALLMAAMGLYGVMSFMVVQRRREIGVRVALGAERVAVLRMVLGQGARLVLLGSAIGLGFGFLLTRAVASVLGEVNADDVVTFIGVPTVLLTVALVANLVPARRATRIDPMLTLRSE